jgi:hypothetical protein
MVSEWNHSLSFEPFQGCNSVAIPAGSGLSRARHRSTANRTIGKPAGILPPAPSPAAVPVTALVPTPSGQAALAAAQALAKHATAPAILRAYKADWTHFSQWCTAHGFVGALRRSERVSLRVEDVAVVAGGSRRRIVRGKTDQAGQAAEVGLPRGRPWEPARFGRSRPGRRWQGTAPDRP